MEQYRRKGVFVKMKTWYFWKDKFVYGAACESQFEFT
jgi:hypothetical protein